MFGPYQRAGPKIKTGRKKVKKKRSGEKKKKKNRKKKRKKIEERENTLNPLILFWSFTFAFIMYY